MGGVELDLTQSLSSSFMHALKGVGGEVGCDFKYRKFVKDYINFIWSFS